MEKQNPLWSLYQNSPFGFIPVEVSKNCRLIEGDEVNTSNKRPAFNRVQPPCNVSVYLIATKAGRSPT
ncbi:hypothetical protein MLD38_008830 [Melastoma candidum]|uniref:Uncharacterized protein n=1 Tax=Melastoma candidum TaxID=119954 RepID=A0ACB9RUS4_9MYRT|nr:hypothetical protein MLD38_008830 [Melastoma candidum]